MSTTYYPTGTTESRDTHPESAPLAWPPQRARALMLRAVREASVRGRRLGHAVVASVTLPAPALDPLRIFAASRASGHGDAFYWERPSEDTTLVALGAAATVTAAGSACVHDASTAWRRLVDGAVHLCALPAPAGLPTGPALVGGFAFDPLARRTDRWQGFPDALLLLPRLLLSRGTGASALTLNTLVTADADAESVSAALLSSAMRALAAAENDTTLAPVPPSRIALHEPRPANEWQALVAACARRIQAGEYEKVVLARAVEATAATSFDPAAVLRRLRVGSPAACVFALRRGRRTFVGATPERLARVDGGRVRTMALAGSTRRGATPAEDDALGAELLRSAKNAGEHRIVAESVVGALHPLCTDVRLTCSPELLKLPTVQHLRTTIEADLAPGRCILDVVGALHPTPAVGGHPREVALRVIRDEERLDRGWYAGPIGWVGPSGDGEFAVALRSALLGGERATLFAGCGIVGASDPQAEYDESALKLQPMLRALAGED